MSLVLNLAVLAEGAATDSRGSLTLVAVNPQAFIADQFPAQFAPIFVIVIEENVDNVASSVFVPGRSVALRVQATGPDGDVVFYSQIQQVVPPAPHPRLPPRVQLLAQVPFPAPKAGKYEISGRIAIKRADGGEEVIEATRNVLVADSAILKSEPS
jgi:hypothetical protein